jgi:hypothetical protein
MDPRERLFRALLSPGRDLHQVVLTPRLLQLAQPLLLFQPRVQHSIYLLVAKMSAYYVPAIRR